MVKTQSISIKKIDEFGNIRYYNEQNQLHREDGPAVECPYGYMQWWHNGKWLGISGADYDQNKFEKWLALGIFI